VISSTISSGKCIGCVASRHFWNKKEEYQKDKINELAVNSNSTVFQHPVVFVCSGSHISPSIKLHVLAHLAILG
jgi:hypothetical protein